MNFSPAGIANLGTRKRGSFSDRKLRCEGVEMRFFGIEVFWLLRT